MGTDFPASPVPKRGNSDQHALLGSFLFDVPVDSKRRLDRVDRHRSVGSLVGVHPDHHWQFRESRS